MEKQIQTLTSELNHLKNNRNKVANSETEYHSQQQNQTTPFHHHANYKYFKEVKTHFY